MSFRRIVSLVLLAAYLPACTAYHGTDQPLVTLTAPPKPVSRVRVTTLDGSRIQVWSPQVRGDSLHGFTKTRGADTIWVAMPLAGIRSTEVQKVDAVMTVGGVALAAAAAVGVFTLIYLASCDPDGFSC